MDHLRSVQVENAEEINALCWIAMNRILNRNKNWNVKKLL